MFALRIFIIYHIKTSSINHNEYSYGCICCCSVHEINELLKFSKFRSIHEFVVSKTIQLKMMGERNKQGMDGIMRETERERERENERMQDVGRT